LIVTPAFEGVDFTMMRPRVTAGVAGGPGTRGGFADATGDAEDVSSGTGGGVADGRGTAPVLGGGAVFCSL